MLLRLRWLKWLLWDYPNMAKLVLRGVDREFRRIICERYEEKKWH